ncbi:sensor histidine kinase [Novosphingobium sp. 9U]|uniref:sensor histidine kinase n=1 Tax=Novosphingobium sp. 9U TaxID=2653158 RepID=UPI001F264A60|nr:histidine kinase [Novosphingobium sp. 9U]
MPAQEDHPMSGEEAAAAHTPFQRTVIGPVLVVWGFGYLLVDIIAYLLGRSVPGLNLLASVPLFALGVSQTLALHHLRARLRRQSPLLRWPPQAVALLLATAVQAAFDLYWLRWVSLTFIPEWQVWTLNINLQRLFTVGILYLWTFCLSLTLLWAMHVRGAAHAAAARAAAAEAAAARSEAAALRLQLNPHFMFNALNSISSLVLIDRKDEAEEMIMRLCEFLRGSLGTDPMADVPVAQEIEVIRAYLGIESARFGDNLHVSVQMDPAVAQVPVPNFILQPLVENAIKHGVARSRGASRVVVDVQADGGDLVLSVFNSTTCNAGGRSGEGRQGIGLHIIRQRLAIRFAERAALAVGPSNDGYRAEIRLPLDPMQPVPQL